EFSTYLRVAFAEEGLARDRVLARGPPLEVRPEHPVVAAAPDLAVGGEQAHERLADIPAQPADGHERAELLVGEVGAVGPGKDHAAPAVVLAEERGVGGAAELAGAPHAPAGGGDGARIHGLDRRAEQLDAFQEEGPLL